MPSGYKQVKFQLFSLAKYFNRKVKFKIFSQAWLKINQIKDNQTFIKQLGSKNFAKSGEKTSKILKFLSQAPILYNYHVTHSLKSKMKKTRQSS